MPFDLTPFVPVISVAVGALATIGGVAITARSSRKADDKRLTLETERETTRIRREDEAAQTAAFEAKARKQTETYDAIAQHFVGELSNLRAQRTTRPELRYNEFDKWFKSEWPVNADTRLRRVIATLTNDDHRIRITQICDAIMDHENVALQEFMEGGEQVEVLLTLGFDLASAYARGQQADRTLLGRFAAFEKQVREAADWKERQRQEDLEKNRRSGTRCAAVSAVRAPNSLSRPSSRGWKVAVSDNSPEPQWYMRFSQRERRVSRSSTSGRRRPSRTSAMSATGTVERSARSTWTTTY
jgi:hypothetical protein